MTFNISLAGTDVNRTLVKNLGRNIIRKLVVKLEGNEIISIDDYDILYSYYDCCKCTTERLNAVFQGIVEPGGGALQLHLYGGVWPQDWKIDPSAD